MSKIRQVGPSLLRSSIENYAKARLGFDLVGFSAPFIEKKYLDALRSWQELGRHAEMEYMQEFEKRADLSRVLPGVKSVIVLGFNYYYPQPDLLPNSGRVARYAYGRDYHKILGKKLKELTAFLTTIDPNAKHKPYVDTGPVLERALAEQAGLGTIGKNTLLITREFGSWVLLAEILTTLDLGFSESKKLPRDFGLCGRCTKCLDACPTGAIVAPGVVDARRCISYLTIENKGSIPRQFAKKISETKRLFGCDICQEVCPHNAAKQVPHHHSEILDSPLAGDQLTLQEIEKATASDSDYLKAFAGSPLMRTKRTGLKRNAQSLILPLKSTQKTPRSPASPKD